jgi:2-methylcitrate dehydratase
MQSHHMTDRLAHWINDFDYEAVPVHVLHMAKLSLLDALGGAFAARAHSEAARKAIASLDVLGEGGASSVIGQNARSSVVNAVFANSLLIRALDYNDYLPTDPNDGKRLGSHPSDNMAVGLSVGEKCGSSGRDFLAAMVMGYELNGRLLRLFDSHSFWDSTSATGLVAPAIAGRLMGLDADRLSWAIAFGMAHGVTHKSVRRGHISAAKFLADPIVARHGAFATLLASCDVPGPVSVLDGATGLGKAVFTDGNVLDLVRPLASRYIFEGVCIKAYPCFANSQAAIAAALEVRRGLRSPSEMAAIDIRLADIPAVTSQLADSGRRYPTNQETADHSYHFVIAAALVDGEVTLRSFHGNRWEDPVILDVMNRLNIIPDAGWNSRQHGGAPATVTVTTTDGRVLSADFAYQPGHVRNPMTTEQVAEKFRSNVDGILDSNRTRAIVDAVLSLDEAPSLHGLMALLRT